MRHRRIDVSGLRQRIFYYRDEGVHREGIELTADGIVYFKDETVHGLGGATPPYSVEEFLAEPGNGFVAPDHPVVREILDILRARSPH